MRLHHKDENPNPFEGLQLGNITQLCQKPMLYPAQWRPILFASYAINCLKHYVLH